MAPPPEIAIPSTSISDETSSKPYTLYNITLRLPLRSYVVQKRYSDFSRLHEALLQQAGGGGSLPPPHPLPPKHWLRSTVGSPELTRERQVGLERYLRTIAESPDRRWRDTPAWRAFLNLPCSTNTTAAVSTSNSSTSGVANSSSRATAAAAQDPAAWLELHKELKQLLHEARISLSRRDVAADAGNMTGVAEAAAAARKSVVRAGTLVVVLADGLRKMQEGAGGAGAGAGGIGDGELRRRRDLLSTAKMEREGLEKLANSMPVSAALGASSGSGSGSGSGGGDGLASLAEKAKLLSNSNNSNNGGRRLLPTTGRRLGGGGPTPVPAETDKTRELDNQGVLTLQRQEMEAQDAQVEQLAAIIRRQKEMGLQINEEVERQTEMLGLLDEDEGRVRAKLGVANKRIGKM